MKMRLQGRLLFVPARLSNGGKQVALQNVVVDTGSATTIFATHKVESIGLRPEPDDVPRSIRGIGGTEHVLTKRLDHLMIADFELSNATIEIGGLGYGPDLDGIVGLDFLLRVRAVIDLDRFELRAPSP
jgi:hypothetical protein